jgi:hypothetical protein
MADINASSSTMELEVLLGRSIICIIGGTLPTLASLGDSFLWRFFRLFTIAGLIGLSNRFTLIENANYRIFTAALVFVLGLVLDSVTTVVALNIMLHFNLPPYIRYLSFDATDAEIRGQFLLGAIPMGFYISTVLSIGHAGALWAFIWRVIVFGLPSIMLLYQIWSILVNQRRKEVLSHCLLKGLKRVFGTTAYVLLRSVEISKTLFDLTIAFLHQSEGLVIRLRQSSGEGPYRYKSLNVSRGGIQRGGKSTQKIRLLKLLRRKLFTKMECKLIIVNVNDAPPYEAISYTWGNEKPSIEIIVDNATLKVTPAVSEILEYRHSFIGTKLFWIDSICINQSDDDEKSQQVTLMKQIYSRASRVVVWLGPLKEAKDAYLAVEMLMTIFSRRMLLSTSLDDLYREFFIKGNPAWNSMVKLFQHPWFSRVWIVQEVAVGTTVHVMYGNTCTGWDDMAVAIRILADPRLFGPAQVPQLVPTSIMVEEATNNFPNAVVIADIRHTTQSNRPMTLSMALSLCYGLKASRIHDKVYAMLGIIWDTLPGYMTPDYSKPESKVYEDTMRYLLSRPAIAGVPHVLQFAGTGWPRSPEMEASNLPSWVADWGSPSPTPWLGAQSESWITRNAWAMQNLLVVQVMDGLSMLKVETVKVDKIRSLGTARWGSTNVTAASSMEIFTSWLREAKSMAQSSYGLSRPHEKFPYESFWTTLTGGDGLGTTSELSSSPPAEVLLGNIEAFWELNLKYNNLSSISEAERQTIAEQIVELGATVTPLSYRLAACCRGNRFCVTGEGHFAIVPPRTTEGDSIYFLRGLQSPFILREKDNLGENSVAHYEMVGSCYVDGMMDENRDGLVWEEYILE